jgi:hypothetical protein
LPIADCQLPIYCRSWKLPFLKLAIGNRQLAIKHLNRVKTYRVGYIAWFVCSFMPEASSSQTPGPIAQVLCCARLALKQSLHKTGLPVDGLNGTESLLPH